MKIRKTTNMRRKTKKMNKSRAIKNSECYYELNMLKLLFKNEFTDRRRIQMRSKNSFERI